MVKITFKSMKDVGNIYEIFLKDLNDSISANASDYQKLEEIRQKLLGYVAHCSNLQANIKYRHLKERKENTCLPLE